MKKCLPQLVLALITFLLPWPGKAQLLIQDFDLLPTVEAWADADSPTVYQMSYLGSEPLGGTTNTVFFELSTEVGDQELRLIKANSQNRSHRAFFMKNTGSAGEEVLKLQFDLAVTSAPGTKDALGSFYIGQNLGNTGFYPDHKDRFATIDLSFEGGDAFSVANVVLGEVIEKTATVRGEARITVFLNNSGSAFAYLSPAGTAQNLASKKIDIWIDDQLAINEAQAHAAEGVVLSDVKFSSRNNQAEGTATFDNLLVEPVQPYASRPVLSQAGGTFTVGSGGQFGSLSNPGGVFEALNAIQGAITAPFVFRFVSDLLGETGAVALQEIAGAAEGRTISFMPQQQDRSYTISGDNKVEEGGMLILNGADWVVFDGRPPGDRSEGLDATRQLIFRNAGTASTFVLQQDATRNTIAYSTIQGVSTADMQGVITFSDALANGNDKNIIRYNRIGGYGSQQPANAIAAQNTGSEATDEVLIEGNQFYGFAAIPSVEPSLEPGVIRIMAGHEAWTMRGNHFYQAGGQAIITAPGAYRLVGIRLEDGAGHLVEENYLGGKGIRTSGGKAKVEAPGPAGGYPSVLPFLVDNAAGSVQFIGNTIREIEISGRPSACAAQAFGALVMAGTADFTDNTFGTKGDKSIVVRTRTGSGASAAGYRIVPIYYRGQSRGRVRGNFIGGVSLEAIPEGGGTAEMAFAGILSGEAAQLAEISQNTIANIWSATSGQAGVSITGILAAGTGATSILRNVLYDFYNDASTTTTGCESMNPAAGPSVNGIVVDHGAAASGEVLLANNMITFYSPSDLSTSHATYHGILLPATMGQTVHVYYNSIFVHGQDNAATEQNFLLYRSGTAPAVVKNNLLLNTRSTDKQNFVLGSLYDGWVSDHNLLYQAAGAGTKDFGLFATNGDPANAYLADDCVEWQRISGQDQQSVCENAASYLVDPMAGNLRMLLSLDNNPVIDKGTPVAQINTDIDMLARVVPDIGASEGYNAWIGAESTDWFDSRNWSAGRVPDCEGYSQLVILPQGAAVPAQAGAGSVLHQPVIRAATSPAVYRNLLVLEGAALSIGEANAQLQQCNIDDAEMEGIYNRGTIRYTAPGEISLQGVLHQEGQLDPGRGLFTLNGSSKQILNSFERLNFWQLAIAGGGDKILGQEIWVEGSLALTSGIVHSSAENMLWLDAEATIGGIPGVQSYVAGPMAKRFAAAGQEFVFPLGDADVFGPVALILSDTGGQGSSFLAEYQLRGTENSAELPPATQMAEGLSYVSDYEAWRINRLEGEAAARVGLYYHELSGIAEPEDAEVVRWTPAGMLEGIEADSWALTGEQEMDENLPWNLAGPRILSAPLDFFTFFTFGSQKPQKPLPVTLLSFKARLEENHVLLNWVTAMEENSSHFHVQRSLDGQEYHTLARLEAAGNSHELVYYQFADEEAIDEFAGEVYYRLEQADIDGSLDWSAPVLVQLGGSGLMIESIYPNPFGEELQISFKGAKTQLLALRLQDMQGRTLLHRESALAEEEASLTLAGGLQELPAGLYVLEVRSAGLSRQFKVVKK